MPTTWHKSSFRAAIHFRKGNFHKWLGKRLDSRGSRHCKGKWNSDSGKSAGSRFAFFTLVTCTK